MGDKRTVRRKLIIEGLLALLITISPILFYSYKYIPYDDDTTWSLLGLNFTDNGYGEIAMAFYFYLSKLIPLILLAIWFVTCKHWWYHAILLPISMYAFQLYSVFSDDIEKIDENEILYLVAVCMIIIPVVYFIRLKLVDKYVHGIDLKAMDEELKTLKEKQGVNKNESEPVSTKTPKEINYKSLSEKINEKLSTHNIESHFRQFQNQLGDWLHFKI